MRIRSWWITSLAMAMAAGEHFPNKLVRSTQALLLHIFLHSFIHDQEFFLSRDLAMILDWVPKFVILAATTLFLNPGILS
jgi:hypothetical protein